MHMLTASVLSVVGTILYQLVPVDRDRHQKCSYTYAHIYINIQMYKCEMSTLHVHYGAQQSPDSVYIMTSVHSVLV